MEITFNWLADIANQQGFNKAWHPHFDIDYDLLYDKCKIRTVKRVYDLFAQFINQLGALLLHKPLATRYIVSHYNTDAVFTWKIQ